jgi:hypothetical protein
MLPTTIVLATVIAMLFPMATISRSNGRSLPKRQYTEAQIHNTTTSTECSAVHVIVDRATGEPPSQGVIGTLATLIALRVPDTTVEWVNYPAVLVPYDQSTATGIEMTKARVQDYADSCPVAKIILLGYSQGAQVVGDVLCGGGGAFGLGPLTDPLEDEYLRRVAAVVQMGDPRFVANQAWNAGTSKTNGVSFSTSRSGLLLGGNFSSRCKC